jgi:predicted anti-sigma-YlaC factor YlaD
VRGRDTLIAASLLLATILSGTACSIRKFAVNKLGDALAGTGTTFAADEDPELIAGAVPFSLKLIESLLAESPRHRGLLLAATRGFVQYAYAFVQSPADQLESQSFAAAEAGRERARKLYLRARGYGLRLLELDQPGVAQRLASDPRTAAAGLDRRQLESIYWTTAAWAGAIALSKDDPARVAEIPQMEALLDRAYALDPDYQEGALETLLISYEMARMNKPGKPTERARHHFARAVELSAGQDPGPYLALAETVCVQEQARAEFEALLDKALAIDPDALPEKRLATIVQQRRAAWLRSRIDELFLSEVIEE